MTLVVGYPIGTVAFYGPDEKYASKVAVAIVKAEGDEPTELERWFAEDIDVRTDPAIANDIVRFLQAHGAKSVVMTDRIIGCPHEEGIDYPEGQVCPRCPFWAHRDRWTGDIVQQLASKIGDGLSGVRYGARDGDEMFRSWISPLGRCISLHFTEADPRSDDRLNARAPMPPERTARTLRQTRAPSLFALLALRPDASTPGSVTPKAHRVQAR